MSVFFGRVNSLGMMLHPDTTDIRAIKAFHEMPTKITKITKHHETGVCKYSYDKVVFVNGSTKVIITCKIHGDFEQKPVNHLQGKGCGKCGGSHKYTTEEFISKAREVHGDGYSYDKVIYVKTTGKVIITCRTQGDFRQKPSHHLQGFGCSKCSGQHRPTTEEWVKKARKVHGNEYIYDKVTYVKAMVKVVITCRTHGDFRQLANDHLRGHGCQHCGHDKTKYEIYKDRPTTLYYVKFIHPVTNVEAWKIGLTTKTIEERFKPDISKGYEVEVIESMLFADGYVAYMKEQSILKQFKNHRPYDNTKNPYLYGQGNTEVFNRNIHGHIHNTEEGNSIEGDQRYFNVNIDANNYEFVELDAIKQHYRDIEVADTFIQKYIKDNKELLDVLSKID